MAVASRKVSADSLDAVLEIQRRDNILISNNRDSSASGATPARLNIALVNQSSSSNVYAYLTGLSINNNNAVWLLQADGQTDYLPQSPSADQQDLGVSCAIPLGGPGSTKTVSIPQVAGGRIWFSYDTPLQFKLNRGPGLVQPSSANLEDPNHQIRWDFCEFTWNSTQLYANISYVDFCSIPVALDLESTTGASVQSVKGMPPQGLKQVCDALTQQSQSDHQDWDKLIVKGSDGTNLRALSPSNGLAAGLAQFSGYYEPYVDQVWNHYEGKSLSIDTQASYGVVTGQVTSGLFTFTDGITFTKPNTSDIFGCSGGPFTTNGTARDAIVPRLAAAFNRSTLLMDESKPLPDGDSVGQYYQNAITNHYSRICHEVTDKGQGYGFPYDDVASDPAHNPSGFVADPSPKLWTVTIGGAMNKKVRIRRDIEFMAPMPALTLPSDNHVFAVMADEKAQLNQMVDIERGEKFPENWEAGRPLALRNEMPPVLKRVYERMAPHLQPLLNNDSLLRVVDVTKSAMSSILSASARAVVSRVVFAALVLLFYMMIEFFNKSAHTSSDAAPRS